MLINKYVFFNYDKILAKQNKKKDKKKNKSRLNFITLKDYDELNPYEAMIYDKRSFAVLFFDHLKKENILFNLLFNYSVIEPLWIRIIMFYFQLSLMFASSAFFFSDDYIDARASLPENQRVFI